MPDYVNFEESKHSDESQEANTETRVFEQYEVQISENTGKDDHPSKNTKDSLTLRIISIQDLYK